MLKRKSVPATGKDFIAKPAKNILFRKNSNGTVLIMKLDDEDFFFKIDGLAAEIWLKIDGKTALSKIRSQILSQFKAPEARFDRDLNKFMSQLKKEKLIQS
jgi:hypothetical protein